MAHPPADRNAECPDNGGIDATMTSMFVRNLKRINSVIATLISLSSITFATSDSTKTGVDFQVVVDKLVYSPGSTMNVKFILTNTGETPLYITRSLSECSNIEGAFFFRILDQKGHDVTSRGCSSDVGPAWETHVIDQVIDPKLWIALQPGEIFGRSSAFELPKEKGTYRLRAEITPPGFTDKQREMLSQKEIRVLQSPCPAPIVTITIK